MKKLKILSYNLHKGFKAGNFDFVLHEMKVAIHRVSADIVFLQEVIGDHKTFSKKYVNWPDPAQFEYLADQEWPHYAYGKNAIYEEGHHGNAILSKYPFIYSENIDVSTNKFEKRGLLHGIIELPGQERLHLFCVHLDLLERGRKKQVKLIIERIKDVVKTKERIILAGDFNDWSFEVFHSLSKFGLSEAFHEIKGKCPKTFPSFYPLLSLDRIFIKNMKII